MTVGQLMELLKDLPRGAEVRIAEGAFDMPVGSYARVVTGDTAQSVGSLPEAPYGPGRATRVYLKALDAKGYLPDGAFEWSGREEAAP